MSEELYLIWSEEHGAWWCPHRLGYTRSILEAGRYSNAEASEIVKSANQYLDPHEPIREIAIPWLESTSLCGATPPKS